ncbi:pilus assembly protein [Alkalisalibacterium limincola]|uniref:Pilus assembly protein n=2 Tax=Alkalisalibacterium limincola TaxID=2699169 RepID=A0A5C8KR79_9GAMM|nr:pilus assembly protein [Alkalisalibacterium limincola]
MKVAKAGASYAFSELGENIRVGYRTLHNQSNFDIPVNVDGGLFRDQSPGSGNRSTWYSRLLSASGSGNTPSARALNEAGQYFSTTTASGPWGPEAPENQLSCRQNFAILTSDGYWNETPVTTTDGDDVAGLVITSPTGQTYQYTPQRPYSDGISNTLADVAMRYWKTDLRPDLDNDVPTTPGNPAFWQHMVTFGISLGLAGTLNPETDLPALTDGTKSWPDPHPTRNATRIDDMWHATVNGRGEFVVVTDPEAFAAGLTEALDSITERTNSGSNVAANSVALRDETRIFQASYVGGRWTGEVAAYPISAAGVAANPVWRATDPGNIPAFEARKAQVFTFGDNQGRNFFAHRNAGLGAIDGYNVAEYLLGNAAGEERNSGTLRNRTSVLGDIVHSSPAFVGDVDSGALFVGANDGMMHAFDSETGKELFAYVPGGISNERLRLLTDPAYSHQYYVDGPIAVSSQTQTPGVNYLIGTLGRGGKGLYALDVTNPKTFAAGNVLWDTAATNLTGWTTQNAQADLGMVLNRPLIARTNGRTGNQNSAMLPAMAIFGNGINSTSGRASLFIVDLKTGALVRNIRVGPAGDTNNGITSVRGWDEDGDGLIDYVFAADMKGNIWKFDLDYFDVDKWGVADGGTIQGQLKRASGGDPLIATGRPITGGMQVTFHPTTYETWLMFGTGKYLEESDINSTGQERWYGVIDNGTRITNIGTQLTQRNLVVSANIDGTPVRGFQPHAPLPADSRGWFVNLQTPPTGQTLPPSERMVAEPLMVGRVLVAASILPSADPCDAGGTGYLNAIDAFTGTSVQRPFFDVNNDGSFDDDVIGYGDGSVPVGSVNLGIAMPTSPTVVENLLVAGGSLGTTGAVGINNPLVKGRISWREILGD